MKAITYTDFGPAEVLRLTDVDKPAPKEDQVLIRVHAVSLNPIDWRMMRGDPSFLRLFLGRKPKGIGRDVAGRVEAVGRKVTRLEPGDEVFGTCAGSLAEYVRAAESALAIKPPSLTFEQAACVGVAALTALQGLRDKGRLQAGKSVLINGASGGVGTFAVQIAKALGAQVTGVCSARNVEMVRSLGADQVIDYTQEDFTKSGRRWDLILDNVGNHSLSAYRRILSPKGVWVGVGAPKKFRMLEVLAGMLQSLLLTLFTSQRFVTMIAKPSHEDLAILSDLMVAGKVTPVIDRTSSFSEFRQAIAYLEQGHARGKVVITMDHAPAAEPRLS